MSDTLNYQAPGARPTRYVTRRRLKRLLLGGVVALAGFVVFLGVMLVKDSRRRERSYQRALVHVPAARVAITGDPRFSRVTVDASNGKYGVALWATGTVANIQDRDALYRAIDATRPPVRINVSVWVESAVPATTNPTNRASSRASPTSP